MSDYKELLERERLDNERDRMRLTTIRDDALRENARLRAWIEDASDEALVGDHKRVAVALSRALNTLQFPTDKRVGTARQGWRARLANVERLLTELDKELVIREQRNMGEPPDYLGERVLEALAEVRSMLDGDTS